MRLINVFIGGSTEALEHAQEVKDALEASGEIKCTIWNDGVFGFNQTFLRALTQACYSFDFGLLIASKDDIALIRENIKDIPRDNIILEYGLFLGVLSNNRTFLVQEKGTNLPTDLLGYTTPQYEREFTKDDWASLGAKLTVEMKNQFKKSEIQTLPSTALAIGYFNSFLKPVSHYTYLKEDHKALLNDNDIEHLGRKIQVVIPSKLSDDICAKATKYYNDKKYTLDGIGKTGRPFPIRFYRQASNLVIVDMPTALNAIRPSVNLLVPDTGLGVNDNKIHIERRELENFKKTLEYLVAQDDYANSLVEVIWDNEF